VRKRLGKESGSRTGGKAVGGEPEEGSRREREVGGAERMLLFSSYRPIPYPDSDLRSQSALTRIELTRIALTVGSAVPTPAEKSGPAAELAVE
jgi:hypothetical protein